MNFTLVYAHVLRCFGCHEVTCDAKPQLPHVTPRPTKHQAKFDMADANGDGFITSKEFEDIYVQKTGKVPSKKDWEKFLAADFNQDFQLTQSEFDAFRICGQSND